MVNFQTFMTLHGMLYNIILLWGGTMVREWYFN